MNTKERLIATTADLISRKGFRGMGINEVLAMVEVPKGSLYHHFPKGKESLVSEAVKYGGRQQMDRYGAALRGKGAEEGLKAIIDVMINDLERTDFEEACPIAIVALEASEATEDIRKACDEMFRSWQKGLAAYLERRGVENALEKSEQFYALLEGGFILSKAHRDVKYLQQQKRLVKMILES